MVLPSGCISFHSHQQCMSASCFSASLPTFVTCGLFDVSHADRLEVIPHCGFLDDSWCVFMWLMVSFRSIYLGLLPIPDWLVFKILSCMCCLYIWEIKPLLITSVVNIFSHSVGFFFFFSCFVCGFLYCAKAYKFNSVQFSFAFLSFALGDWPKKTLVRFMSKNILPVFSSTGFMVSCLIFRSLSHFEFVYFCVWCEGVFWFHWCT